MADTLLPAHQYQGLRTEDPDGRFDDQAAPPRGRQQFLDPPSWPLTGQEFLRITAVANVAGITVDVVTRVRKQNGDIARTLRRVTPGGSRTATTLDVNIGDGALLSVIARSSSGVFGANLCFVALDLVIGQSGEQQQFVGLASGYVGPTAPLFAPLGLVQDFTDGAGAIRTITATVPGAGAEVSETVPTGARWELLSLAARFVANATVANRFFSLTLDDGSANPWFRSGQIPTATTAGQTVFLDWSEGMNSLVTQQGFQNGLPVGNKLAAGYRIKTSTSGIQAGDQYDQIQYCVREWLEV